MRKGGVGKAGRHRDQARDSQLGPRTPPTEAAHSIAQRGAADFIVETTYDGNEESANEDAVASVAALPREAKYDKCARVVSLARGKRGNTLEQIMDGEFDTHWTRLPCGADCDAQWRPVVIGVL